MSLIRKFASVGGATMASRVLGFVREALIAGLLGAGPIADAFYAALRFPNLFRRFFAEGAFNAAFVPLFAEELETHGKEAAQKFAAQVLSALVLILFLISALAMTFMPFLVSTIVAPKFVFDPVKFEQTVLYARIMFPYLAAMSLVALLAGVLNSLRHYFLAALAPVVLNILMVGALLFSYKFNLSHPDIGFVLSISVVISGLLQFILLFYAVRKLGIRFELKLPELTPKVKRLLILALPATITGGITQINLLVSQIIASAQGGAISIINFADRIFQLPLGVIAIAIGVVLLPELTRALAAKDYVGAQSLQSKSLEFGLALTIPAAVAFAIIPEALVSILFERGAFTRENTLLTASVLTGFAAGLPAFVMIKVFTPAFYARQEMRIPMWFSLISVGANIVGSLVLFPKIGVVGIAISTTLSGYINAILLGSVLIARKLYVPEWGTIRRLLLIVFSSFLMAVCLWFINLNYQHLLLDGAFFIKFATLSTTIFVCILVYFSTALITGAIEKKQLRKILKR